MIALDCLSGDIKVPKVDNYEEMMHNIKRALNVDDNLFSHLYLSFIDEEEQERTRLIPQIYDDFIKQKTPKITVGFLDNLDDDTLKSIYSCIEANKKRLSNQNQNQNINNNINNIDNINSIDDEDINTNTNNNKEQGLDDFNSKFKELQNIMSSNNDKNNNKENEHNINNNFENEISDIISKNLSNLKDQILTSVLSQTSGVGNSQIKKYNTIHQGIKCDLCGMNPIKGNRYKCVECKDFNLCQNCEATNKHPHPFYKIKYSATSIH